MTNNDSFDPWSAPKEPKKKAGGGSNSNNSGGGNRKTPEQEMEDAMRKFREAKDKIFGGGNSGTPSNPKRMFAVIGGGLLVLWLLFGSIFLVSPGEAGAVLRFGEYNRTVEEGLNFKLPYPFEQAYIRNVEKINETIIGANKTNEEGLMVTGDENIVDTEFVIRWKINDLNKFLFSMRDAEYSVPNAAESVMREVVGNLPLEAALGEASGRAKIALEVEQILQRILDSYNSGIQIVGVDLKQIDVAQQVKDAQIDVQNAKTEQERVKNQAEAYSNDIIPRARGDAAQKIQEAEGYKEAVISKAKGDTSRFLAVYEQYKLAKDVTKKRIYLETMQEVMKGMDKIILDDKGGALPYLPLNSKGGVNAQ
jgi:membrane protease subunit HflK